MPLSPEEKWCLLRLKCSYGCVLFTKSFLGSGVMYKALLKVSFQLGRQAHIFLHVCVSPQHSDGSSRKALCHPPKIKAKKTLLKEMIEKF